MDALLQALRDGLAAGPLASSGWQGVNSPTHLERSSGLWVSHGTAWRYAPGTTAGHYINPLWEWAVVFEGAFVLRTPARVYTVTAPCCYIVPPGLELGVQVTGTATLAAWFMLDGPLAAEALAACGGQPDAIVVGPSVPARAEHALRIARLLDHRPPGFPALLQAELWAFLAAQTGAAGTEQRPVYSAEITRVLRYIDAHAHEPPVPNGVLARIAALAPASFRRRFTAEVGLPPHAYQLRLRMRRAKHLLLRDDAPIKTVAYDLGFRDQLYFSRLFTRYEGINPRAFRRHFVTERARPHAVPDAYDARPPE